jgi:hypothetical protein
MPVRICENCHHLTGFLTGDEAESRCAWCSGPLRSLTQREADDLLALLLEGQPAGLSVDDYHLPPLSHLQALLAPEGAAEEAPCPRSRVFVWGYGAPQCEWLEEPFTDTQAARDFAARCGWDASEPEAWAREMSAAAPLSQCLRGLEPEFRFDPSIQGWGGEMASWRRSFG